MARLVVLGTALCLVGCKSTVEEPPAPLIAPDITVLQPGPGTWVQAGVVPVSGALTDMTTLEVNGVDTTVRGDTFEGSLELERGINRIEARGLDRRGAMQYTRHAVLAGTFGPPEGEVKEGLEVRVNKGGLDFALGAVADEVSAEEMNASLADVNPVYEDSYGLLWWDAVEIRADVGSIAFGALEIAAIPGPGALDLSVVVPGIEVWVPASGEVVGIDFDVDCWVWVDRAEVAAEMTIGVDGDGQLTAIMRAPQVELLGFDFDTSLLPGEIESWLLVDTLRTSLEEMLLEELDVTVPALLEEQLSTLDLSFETELLETPVTVTTLLTGASIDTEGISLVADIGLDVPGDTSKEHGGVLVADSGERTADRRADFSATISDDLLNRMLFDAWRAGMLDMTLSTEDDTLEAFLLADLGAVDEASVTIDAKLPPVVVESDGKLQAQMGEVALTVLTPGGLNGERIEATASLFIDLELQVVDNVLALSLGELDLQMMVLENDWGAGDEAITDVLEASLPLDALMLLLGDIEFELPELEGFVVSQADVVRDASGVHTGIGMTLQ
jgi:hypothetical protein